MTKIRFQTVPNADGTLGLRRTEKDEQQGSVEQVLNFAEGEDELAAEVTAMLNAYRVRREFEDRRAAGKSASMAGPARDDLVGLAGDEHAAVLPTLQELAREVGQEVLKWNAYADHLWSLLTPPEPLYVPSVSTVRGGGGSALSHYSVHHSSNQMPQGGEVIFDEALTPLRSLYGHAMANVRAYETYLEEIQKRIDQEFGHLPQPPEGGPWRQGHKQQRNFYFHQDGGEIGGKFVGVAFDPEDAKTITEILNEHHHKENNDR